MKSYGFSLIELSIVLVILGLLTGGILTGQSLIRAAELRSMITDQAEYHTATITFRNKYLALPGDMANATQFWGRADDGSFSGQCASPYSDIDTAHIQRTCNGNGNGFIDDDDSIASPPDWFRYWQHLANAGLINGQYRGVPLNGSGEGFPGTEYGSSRLSPNAGWVVYYNTSGNGSYTGDGYRFDGKYGNFMMLAECAAGDWCDNPLLTPEEIWNLDKKMDDGKPAKGKISTFYWDDCTDAANSGDIDADYLFSVTTPLCNALFKSVF